MADARANFATSTVATAPSPANSGTSLVVAAGEGARFPAAPFNAVISPVDALATPANSEIVRVTAKSTDTLTITRAQESSSARTVVVGDRIYWGLTKKTLDDIDSDIAGKQTSHANLTALAGLTGSADKLPYFTGSGAMANADFSSYTRTLIDETSQANWLTALDVYSKGATDFVAAAATVQLHRLAYAPQNIFSVQSAALTASRAYFARFKPDRAMTVTGIAFLTTLAATNNDTYDVGIYTYSGATLTRVASKGATASILNAVAGVKNATISASLTAGTVYYIAFACGVVGGTPGNLLMATAVSGGGWDLFGTALGSTEYAFKASTTLDASISSVSTGLVAGPLFAIRE